MRRRRFTERQRIAMWWVYTLLCLAIYAATFVLSDFLTALVVTCAAIAILGVIVTRLSRL